MSGRRASTDAPSWQDCAAAGMSFSEAARARGVSVSAASIAAKRLGLTFRDARPELAAERMRKLHADPEFAAANAERMRKLNADPARNPLVLLTEDERADYDTCKRAGMTRDEALRAIKRTDLTVANPAEDPA